MAPGHIKTVFFCQSPPSLSVSRSLSFSLSLSLFSVPPFTQYQYAVFHTPNSGSARIYSMYAPAHAFQASPWIGRERWSPTPKRCARCSTRPERPCSPGATPTWRSLSCIPPGKGWATINCRQNFECFQSLGAKGCVEMCPFDLPLSHLLPGPDESFFADGKRLVVSPFFLRILRVPFCIDSPLRDVFAACRGTSRTMFLKNKCCGGLCQENEER